MAAKFYRRQRARLNRKTTRRRIVRWGLVGFNVLLLATASIFVIQNTGGSGQPANAASLNLNAANPSNTPASPIDQISSANIAVTVARLSSLPETSAVTNQADSDATELATVTTDSSVVAKPQVVATNSKSNKDIISYTVQAGDSVPSLAAKFSVTSDSIRWSNNLKADSLKPGTVLLIPPVTGIVYTVKTGDTADSLAQKYNANKDKLIAFNDAEQNGFSVGERIVIPDGSQASLVSAAAVTAASFGWGGGSASYGANGYDFGYCTWWVANLRAKAGNPLPSNLGNAATWAIRAAAFGIPTGTDPRVGAAVVTKTSGAGHVAYVTAVNPDGTITISEMNHDGFDKVDSRTIPSAGYKYIY